MSEITDANRESFEKWDHNGDGWLCLKYIAYETHPHFYSMAVATDNFAQNQTP